MNFIESIIIKKLLIAMVIIIDYFEYQLRLVIIVKKGHSYLKSFL